MDSIADAIYVIDRARMRLVDANETAAKILGYSREELLAIELSDLKREPAEVARTIKFYDDHHRQQKKNRNHAYSTCTQGRHLLPGRGPFSCGRKRMANTS